jgi:hypothetical protein
VAGRVRGNRVWRDLAYQRFGLYIELDGRLGHEGAEHAFRDMGRDNDAVLGGRLTLRYGWMAVNVDFLRRRRPGGSRAAGPRMVAGAA